jgi:hypothetical protein
MALLHTPVARHDPDICELTQRRTPTKIQPYLLVQSSNKLLIRGKAVRLHTFVAWVPSANRVDSTSTSTSTEDHHNDITEEQQKHDIANTIWTSDWLILIDSDSFGRRKDNEIISQRRERGEYGWYEVTSLALNYSSTRVLVLFCYRDNSNTCTCTNPSGIYLLCPSLQGGRTPKASFHFSTKPLSTLESIFMLQELSTHTKKCSSKPYFT